MYSLSSMSQVGASVVLSAATYALTSSTFQISTPKAAAIYGASAALFNQTVNQFLLEKREEIKNRRSTASIIFQEIGQIFVADYCVRSLIPYISDAQLNTQEVISLHVAALKTVAAATLIASPLLTLYCALRYCDKDFKKNHF